MEREDNTSAAERPVVIARAVRVKGLKGEIVAELLTDFPERFEEIDQFFAISPAGEQITVALERYSLQHDRIVLKLAGCNSVDDAKTFVGYDFAVPETDRVELGEGEYYDWELEGCAVKTLNGEHVGSVKAVIRTGGVSLLEVTSGDSDKLIPMAASILVTVDKAEKLIVVDPPEGLLDL